MSIPLTYSLRNLRRRPARTALTVLGVAIVVFGAVLMASLARGVYLRLHATGEEQNLLAISRKGENILFSSIEADELVSLGSLPGVAQAPDGSSLLSAELMDVPPVEVEFGGAKRRSPMNVRGVTPVAYQVHTSVRVVAGRLPEGEFEVLAGVAAHVRLGVPPDALAPGRRLRMYNHDWTVCGTFAAFGMLFESELWTGDSQVQTLLRRRTHSFVVARMESRSAVLAALPMFRQSGAFEKYFKAWPESAYYAEYLESLAWIYWLSLTMAAVVTMAGALIGINTMHTAVLNRMREIATQRVLGFGRLDILRGLLVESVVMAAAGGALGIAFGLCLNDLQFKLSQGVFRLVVDSYVMAAAMAQATLIGIAGALIPAYKGLRLSVIEAMYYGREA